MISYSKIFKQAYAILRAHKFLWALGLFLFWDMGFNFISYANDGTQGKINLNQALQNHSEGIIISAVVALVAVILFLRYAFQARAGIIFGAKSVIEKQPAEFGKSFRAGKKFYLRLIFVWFLTMFLLLLVAVVLATPVVYLASVQLSFRATVLGIVALVIFLPLAVLANFVNNLAPIFIVFYDFKLMDAIRASFDVSRKFWMNFLLFSIWLGILTTLAAYAIAVIWSLGVVFLGHLFYNTGALLITPVSVLIGIIAIAIFLIFTGFVAAFQQVSWVLLFNEIVKAQKSEEEEIVPAPEAIS